MTGTIAATRAPRRQRDAALDHLSVKRVRPAEDTVLGCEARADEDQLRAAAMDTENGQRKLEFSAAVWRQRAEQLRGRAATLAARQAAVMTQRADAEATRFGTT